MILKWRRVSQQRGKGDALVIWQTVNSRGVNFAGSAKATRMNLFPVCHLWVRPKWLSGAEPIWGFFLFMRTGVNVFSCLFWDTFSGGEEREIFGSINEGNETAWQTMARDVFFLGNKNGAASGDKQRFWLVVAFTAVLHLFSPCYQRRSDGTHHFNACETPAVILLLSPTCVCGEKHQRFEGGLTEWSCLNTICPHSSGAMRFFCLIIPCKMNRGDPVKEYVKM